MGNKQNLYNIVKSEGWELPEFRSRAITTDYLFSVLGGTVFRIQSNEIRRYSVIKHKWSKIDLLIWLENNIGNHEKLGMSSDHLPDERWLYNVCYTLNPNIQCFTGLQENEKLVMLPLRYERFL